MQTKGSPGCKAGPGKNPPKSHRRISGAILSVLGLFFHAACSTSHPASSAGGGQVPYIVKADSTPFFKFGPAQPAGPDLRLKKDQLVTMIERHYGYSQVIDPDGDSGYIATDDIAPAPNQTASIGNNSKKSRGAGSRGSRGAPDFDQPNDVPLPKQSPSEEPVPSFRY